jgi:hypothetical protein
MRSTCGTVALFAALLGAGAAAAAEGLVAPRARLEKLVGDCQFTEGKGS